MAETLQTIVTRRSVRNFKPDALPREVIEKIIEAGKYAATGRGMQSPIIIAITSKKVRDEFSKMNARHLGKDESFDPFYGAPVVLSVLADTSRPTYLYDGSLVMGNLMLAAHDMGVGSCWIHRAKEDYSTPEGKALLASLGIEGEYEGIGHCVIGYYDADNAPRKPRKQNYAYFVE